jgi:hypothetical protein
LAARDARAKNFRLFSIMKLTRFFPTLLAVATALIALTSTDARAQTLGERARGRGGEGEAHLVLTYSCPAQNRPALRAHMETKGVAQFEQWKKEGALKSYLILFSHFANAQLEDMWVILDFEKFADIGKWQQIERKFPGGLAAEALALGTPKTCVYTDKGWAGGKMNPDQTKSAYMMIPYQTLVSADEYADFVTRYVEPQLKGWVKAGIMHTYAVHIEQNPTNAPWDSLLVFEYDGLRGIALRDVVKQQVRDNELKDDAGYKHFSAIKRTIRKELQPTTFDAIVPRK